MTARRRSNSDENDITKKVVGKTKKGQKELIIDQTTQGYFFVKFGNGGQLPKELGGRFTRYEFAENAIRLYLEGK